MIAKYRSANEPNKWWLTDFTMEQVEVKIAALESRVKELEQCKDEATQRVIHHVKEERQAKARVKELEAEVLQERESKACITKTLENTYDKLREDVARLVDAIIEDVIRWHPGVYHKTENALAAFKEAENART